jgi:hypothetical protein
MAARARAGLPPAALTVARHGRGVEFVK